MAVEYVDDPAESGGNCRRRQHIGNILVLGGIDQFPESRSIVFSEEVAGDFSAGGTALMLAVRVEMEGRVVGVVETGGL